jgi:nucleotide-binding universal stress UspA family protein
MTFLPKKILVPLDFSDCSKSALRQAIALGERFKAELTLLHVWTAPSYVDPHHRMTMFGRHQTLQQFAFAEVDKEMRRLLATLSRSDNIVASARVEAGDAQAQIIELAAQGYDLVVMGTHGRTGLPHWLLGSVAERVVRSSPCPVYVARNNGDDDELSLKKIIVAVDFSICSQIALRHAVQLAEQVDAEITAMHVVEFPRLVVPHEVILVGETQEPIEVFSRRRASEELAALLDGIAPGAQRLEGKVAVGNVRDELLQEASAGRYDLLVTGTHGHTGWSHLLLGSVGEQLVRRAPCPVLTIRSKDGEGAPAEPSPQDGNGQEPQ